MLAFFEEFAEQRPGGLFNWSSGRRLVACAPMHTFGLACWIAEIVAICQEYRIPVVEAAAESLGSYVGGAVHGPLRHAGHIQI